MNKRQFIVFLALIAIPFIGNSQVRIFDKKSDVVKLNRGDTLLIQSDSVYAVSGNRASYLNRKLDELDTIKSLYNKQSRDQKDLVEKIDELDQLISKMQDQAKQDSLVMNARLKSVMSELNQISLDLRKNNKKLSENNKELQLQTEKLNRVIKDLKKELRGIWWNGIADKIVAFGAGIGTGILIALLI